MMTPAQSKHENGSPPRSSIAAAYVALGLACVLMSFVIQLISYRHSAVKDRNPIKATKLELATPPSSAMIGKPFPVEVRLVDFSNKRTTAIKDIQLNFQHLEGDIEGPNELKIKQGSDSALFNVRFRQSGVQPIIVASDDALLASTVVNVANTLAGDPSEPDYGAGATSDDLACCNKTSSTSSVQFLNKVSFIDDWPFEASYFQTPLAENSKQAFPTNEALKRKGRKLEHVVQPVIYVNPVRELWGNGKDEASIRVSLEEINGDQSYDFKPTEDIVFNLEPRNASFIPKQLKIPKGENFSQVPAKLSAQQPIVLQLSCIPERKYKGVAIRNPQPVKVEFVVPINAMGIDPQTANVQVNILRPLEVYLWDDTDPAKKMLAPSKPVPVQLESEQGNGKVVETSFDLDDKRSSKLVGYVGQRLGNDAVIGVAHNLDCGCPKQLRDR